MKRKLALVLAMLMLLTVFAGCGGNKEWTGKHKVEIEVKNYGTITLEINCDTAPQTASNFLNLAKKGFYNGLTFHRVINGFAIYGGDPNGDGTGNAGSTIVGEFISNGYNNPLSNIRGAIGMARGINYNSASSQFYILQESNTFLDGDFAVFGYVTSGMEVVDQICSTVVATGEDGYVAPDNQPKISSVKVVK